MAESLRWMAVPNAAKVLNVPIRQIQEWISQGQIKHQNQAGTDEVGVIVVMTGAKKSYKPALNT